MQFEPYSRRAAIGTDGYDTAQVCRNGHVRNPGIHNSPQSTERYCSDCGAATVTQCEHCHQSIRGTLQGVVSFGLAEAPSFCHGCGRPYPWTEQALEAARTLISEEMQLEPADQASLVAAVDELVRDTPKTQVAAMTYRRLVKRAAAGTGEVLKEALKSIIAEGAKRALFGPT